MTASTQIFDFTFALSLLMLLFGVVGFFLKSLHSELKGAIDDIVRLEVEISNMGKEMEKDKEIIDIHLNAIGISIKTMNKELIKISEKSSKSDDILIAIHSKIFNEK
jgi:hypothetical protein